MVVPLIVAAGLTAAATVAAARASAKASDNASATNAAINQANVNAGERERLQGVFNAAKKDAEAKQGNIDAFGNRTRFVPGRGFVTEASEPVQRNIDAGLQEQFLQLTRDAALARRGREQQAEQATNAGNTAEALRQAFLDRRRTDSNARTQQLNNDSSLAFNQGFDDAQSAALASILRGGGGGSQALVNTIGDLASERGRALAQVMSGNRSAGRGQTRSEFDTDRANDANLFRAFQSASLQQPTAAPVTAGLDRNSGNTANLAFNRAGQADAIGANAFARSGGRAAFVQPNDGRAKAISTAASGISGALNTIGLLEQFRTPSSGQAVSSSAARSGF